MRKLIRRILGARRLYRNASYLYWTARVQWFEDWKRMTDDSHLRKDWNFESDIEQERHELVLATVTRLITGVSVAKVLELGCSDGVFTARLAKNCASVTACDISPVARDMAARRCKEFNNVVIRDFNLAHDAAPGRYDIIFAMDVFEYIHGKNNLRRVVKRLTDALEPQGLLVYSSCRVSPFIRDAWWQRLLPEGADAILPLIASSPALRMEHSEFHPADGLPIEGYIPHVIAVFSKKEK